MGGAKSSRRGGASASRRSDDYVGRDFVIRHGDLELALEALNGNRSRNLLAEYKGVDGSSVALWDVQGNDNVHYLGFQFGRWTVLVYDYVAGGGQMTEADFLGRELLGTRDRRWFSSSGGLGSSSPGRCR